MKTVFSNNMVAHVWAQQNQENGRSSNGQFYFNGQTIYSYRDSWPLGHFLSNGDNVIFNIESYGNTTSKHSALVRRSTNKNSIYIESTNIMRAIVELDRSDSNRDYYTQQLNDAVTLFINRKYSEALANASKRRKIELKQQDITGAKYNVQCAERIYNALNIAPIELINELQQKLNGDIDNLINLHGDYLKQLAKDQAAKEALRQAELKERGAKALDLWLSGIDTMSNEHGQMNQYRWFLRDIKEAWLRINGDNIETSQGASFPIDHAVKTFKNIRFLKDRNASYTRKSGNNENLATYRLGHFTIDSIDQDGNVKAGCHFVKWEAIERVARELKIFP